MTKKLDKKYPHLKSHSIEYYLRYLKKYTKTLLIWGFIPAILYFIFFCVYSWPWITNFNTAFMTDSGDGLQNVWNIWWVNKSITELNQLPWHTSYLHAPHGVTLLGQTLNPFNGFVGILLLRFMSLVQTFNTMIIFSFVMAGITSFWLCYYFSKKYVPSIIGGFIFTFSSYHFAHALGHMQLVSLEWIPLFILLWWIFLKKPLYRYAIGCSVALLLVLMCDYYYFLYCVLTALFIFIYLWKTRQIPPLKERTTFLPFLLFISLSILIVAPLPASLLYLNNKEILLGSHPTRELSTNIIAPFLNGGFWRFSWLTTWYWDKVPTSVSESSVYLGFSVLAIVVIAWVKRRSFDKVIYFWFFIGVLFGILSYGPRLMIGGNSIESIPLPYALLEKIFPPLKLSGVPVRMMVIVTLSVSVITALTLAKLNLSKRNSKIILGLFLVVLFIDLFPSKLYIVVDSQPPYVNKLKDLPNGVVLDSGAKSAPYALYNQTIHNKPMALGYISRTPKSSEDKNWLIIAATLEDRFNELCSIYKVRYYTTTVTKPIYNTDYPVIYRDNEVLIYDLKDSPNC